jgi:hypothetical protein
MQKKHPIQCERCKAVIPENDEREFKRLLNGSLRHFDIWKNYGLK